MRSQTFTIVSLLFAVCGMFLSCSVENASRRALSNSPLITSEALKQKSEIQETFIRRFDFANFTYPVPNELRKSFGSLKNIAISKGRFPVITAPDSAAVRRAGAFLAGVVYGNVTGKASDEEAIVVLGIDGGGSAMEHIVYIYRDAGNKLELLWAFDTGDRANGGLRKAYSDNGDLCVEKYNLDVLYTENGLILPGGACCATTFTKACYQWTGLGFQLVSAERIPNPSKGASIELKNLPQNQK
jgi:hypothetical protein